MIEIDDMTKDYDTKIRKTAGSMITTIPAAFVKLLELESGDSFTWDLQVSSDGDTYLVLSIKSENGERKGFKLMK